MKRSTVPLLACPRCRGELSVQPKREAELIQTGELFCARCSRCYPVHDGIAHFIAYEEFTEVYKRDAL
jgi:uncharacterized protein YbaR (Trm112 family)